MNELELVEVEEVSGGILWVPILAGIAAVTTIIANAGAVYDFGRGVVDGYNKGMKE